MFMLNLKFTCVCFSFNIVQGFAKKLAFTLLGGLHWEGCFFFAFLLIGIKAWLGLLSLVGCRVFCAYAFLVGSFCR